LKVRILWVNNFILSIIVRNVEEKNNIVYKFTFIKYKVELLWYDWKEKFWFIVKGILKISAKIKR